MNSSSWGPRDKGATRYTAILFGTSSGALSILVPLVLIQEGNSAFVVGTVSMLSGVSQLITRFYVPILMRQLADKFVVLLSIALLSIALLLPILTKTTVVIALAQLIHGAVRALFWTSIQTHSVRGPESAVRGIASVTFFAGIGLMAGPALVGFIDTLLGLSASLFLGLLLSVGGIIAAAFLTNLGPFASREGVISRKVLTRPVLFGSWMSAVAGIWRGLLDTYIPLILVAASFSSSAVSGLIAVSAGAVLVGNLVAPRLGAVHRGASYIAGTTVTSLAFAALLLFGDWAFVAVLVMFICGFISGLFQTYGAAFAADAAEPDLKGDAITLTGIFRSVVILGIPGLVSAFLPFFGLTALGLTIAGGLNAFSFAAISARRETSTEGDQP